MRYVQGEGEEQGGGIMGNKGTILSIRVLIRVVPGVLQGG